MWALNTCGEPNEIELTAAHGIISPVLFRPVPIVHRDLKSPNVLLHEGSAGVCRAKVADFGLSKEFGSAGNTYGGIGTMAWSSPETFNGIFNEKSDIYAFGMVLYVKRFP